MSLDQLTARLNATAERGWAKSTPASRRLALALYGGLALLGIGICASRTEPIDYADRAATCVNFASHERCVELERQWKEQDRLELMRARGIAPAGGPQVR